MMFRPRAINWLFPIFLLLVWEGVVRLRLLPPAQSARPSDVFARLGQLAVSGTLCKHAAWSLFRILLGVGAGTVVAIFSSMSLVRSSVADRLFSPTLYLLAGIPVVVWIPFWVMFFGTDEIFKIAMAAITTYFLVHVQALQAFRSVQKDYSELSEIYEKTHWQQFVHVLLPSATPAIFTAVRTSLAFAWVVIFFVEYASATRGSEGLGWFIADARAIGRVEDEFAALLFLGVIAYITDRILGLVQRRLLVWRDTAAITN